MNRNKAAILSLSLLTIIATDTVAPLVQSISASFPEVSLTMIKQTLTLPSLMMIFFGLLCGQLVRFLSKKTILLIGLVLYSVGGIAAGWSQSFSGHLFLRAMLGAGTGLISPLITSLTADFFEGEERAAMVGNSFAISHLIAVITPPLAAWIGAQNWRDAFFIYTIAPLVMIFAMLALPMSFRKPETDREKKEKIPIPPRVLLYAAIALVIISLFFLLVSDLAYLIDTKDGISSMVSAFGLSTSTLGSTLAGLVFSKMYAKMKKWLVPLGALLCGGGFLLMTSSMVSAVVLLGLLCAGFGIGLLISVITLATTDAVGEADSTAAIGVVSSAFSSGVFISPFFFARLPSLFTGLTPVQSNFGLVGLIFLGAGCVSLLLCVRRRRKRAEVALE